MLKNLLSKTLLGALLISVGNANGQEPTQPNHEKRVYVNDGNTYVQKSLPIYFMFSTSKGGTQYPLTSKKSAGYADPMFLDTEGVNYMRSKWAVDPETGKPKVPQEEVMYELYADGLAPVTRLRFSGANVYRSDRTYYGPGLQLTLTSKDGVSGVENTYYSLGSGSWTNYSGDVSASTEGENAFYYYANDNVGNAEKTKNSKFVVDLSAPTSNHAIVGIVHNGNIIAPSTVFDLSQSDNLSGVNRTMYSFDDRSEKRQGGNVGVSYLPDGEHTLYYYSIDNVKNTESKKSFSFYLDKIAPEVSITINGDQHQGSKYLFVSNRTTVNLSATDNKAGVNKIYYRIDGGERMDFASDFKYPDVKGVHTVKYDATDNVQNLAANKYKTVYMDNKAPQTGIIYGNPQFFHRDTLFVNKDTKITLKARDYESGVKQIQYATDGGGYQNYNQFTIPNEGYHTIKFKTTDNVNNVENEKSSNVYVDNTAPSIYHNFSINSIGTKSGVKVYPNYSRMYLGATDDHVGTKSIMYSINGGPLTAYSSASTIDISERNRFLKKNVKYSVRVVAKDMLGNTSEETFEFYIGLEND
ncbi:MAG: OmpL47-type beta-barrel domain-containing protein [Salibacteraceae bacterium]